MGASFNGRTTVSKTVDLSSILSAPAQVSKKEYRMRHSFLDMLQSSRIEPVLRSRTKFAEFCNGLDGARPKIPGWNEAVHSNRLVPPP